MTIAVPVRDTAEGASFLVRVAPRARRTGIAGVLGQGAESAVKIALQAPAVDGRANAALIEYLAELLEAPRSAITIPSGDHDRNKRIVVCGRSAALVAAAFERARGR